MESENPECVVCGAPKYCEDPTCIVCESDWDRDAQAHWSCAYVEPEPIDDDEDIIVASWAGVV